MKSIKNLGTDPVGLPLTADDLLEFHAARLLLLFRVCGTAGRIEGLTKMAKLDFFVRYPEFFDTACQQLGIGTASTGSGVESSMIRFHYGPWDERYYHLLSYLEAKALIAVTRTGKMFQLALTDTGKSAADKLRKTPAFEPIVEQMKRVKRVFGNKAGSTLKALIYDIFDKEVSQRPLGEVIE